MILDADEFVFGLAREQLQSVITVLHESKSIGTLFWRNCAPADLREKFSVTTSALIGERSPHRKLIIPRWVFDTYGDGATVNQGNHTLLLSNGQDVPLIEVGEILHFPIRSERQFVRKVVSTFVAQSSTGAAPHVRRMINLIADGNVDDETIVGLAMNYGSEDGSFDRVSASALRESGSAFMVPDVAVDADMLAQLESLPYTLSNGSKQTIDDGEMTLTIANEDLSLTPNVSGRTNTLGTFYTDEFYSGQSDGSLRSARAILRGIFDMFPIGSVLDVGCGVGSWLRAASDLGARSIIGVDGDYVNRSQLKINTSSFRARNLERPLKLDAADPQTFDLVISLEVAEHLDAKHSEQFVRNLVAYGDLVLFSAAIPQQGGVNHVNEQWPAYWAEHFNKVGFDCFDLIRMAIWSDDSIDWWYAQNTVVYARRGSQKYTTLAALCEPSISPVALVHPKKLADAYYWALRDLDDATAKRRDIEAQLSEQQSRISDISNELEAARSAQETMLQSHSWRVTKPLRAIRRILSSS
ncbi:hypothetical protein WK15_11830 [Burkholderia ubonensis]|nr:hypothetical protein WK15_11830 [Burkholderia ubonensis]KWB94004.1 hypothetical protein WL45_15845 [Burkholderia ubonensis]KWC17461.1 hypothetical protein WL46_26740 [Burkholderia ubonensis]